jgi:pimeloyl-ACP methyl ester carboxylesterase
MWITVGWVAIAFARSTSGAQDAPSAASQPWRDASPHRVGFVGTTNGRLQYLDWGGRGRHVVLLHGWNSNAHVFDDLAPRLTDSLQVVALTLPGFGESDAPGSGYSLDAAADAVVAALDSLGIARASFAGHSFGGWIMTRVATRHPNRVERLIYLDAAFGLAASDSIVARRPVQRPAAVAFKTQEDVIEWLHRNFFGMWTPALEAEYRGRSADEDARASVLKSIVDDAKRSPEAWTHLTVPSLAICALAEVSSEFPWLSPQDSAYVVARQYVDAERRPFQHSECERFRRTVPNSRTFELPGHHYIFEAMPVEVTRAIRAFLLGP